MWKALIALISALLITGLLLATLGLEPQDRRPGTRLDGVVTPLPTDFSFTDAAPEVHLETYPWFGIPFSVTTVIASDGPVAYVPSIYASQTTFPGTKYWNKVVQADPRVRLRVNGKLYETQITPITDPAEFDRAFLTLASKYPFWQTALEDREKRPHMALLRLAARS